MGACERCLGTNCYGAPCNFDCIDYGTFCETRVMGGAGALFDAVMKAKDPSYDHCEFLCQRVMRCNRAMEKAGIEVGDTLTHINKNFFSDQKSFADAVSCLPPGTELRVIKPDGTALEVTLK